MSIKRVAGIVIVLAVIVAVVAVMVGMPSGSGSLKPKISLVNSPTDIATLGAQFMADEIAAESDSTIQPTVYHSGVLSGGKGNAEIEMCQQGTIEMHVTTTAYLANIVPKTSIFSLPFLFRDVDQMVGLVEGKGEVLDTIDRELNAKNLHVIAWWPRGFRQLTNSRRTVRTPADLHGLKLRVMNNPLYVDTMTALDANPVPMDWGEVYNGLQLKTIDGQENAENVIHSSRLYETQKYMTVWDYSTDIEVVLVNLGWWNGLSEEQRAIIQRVADASTPYEAELLEETTGELRRQIADEGVEIYYMPAEDKEQFEEMVKPVWDKYEAIFTTPFMDAFMAELAKY